MAAAVRPLEHLLGRFAKLELRRFTRSGAYLVEPGARAEAPSVLLLGSEVPPGLREGDSVSVFLYLDSDGRPLATTAVPKLALGEVAFLTVTACTEFGAFVDWGLPKELLVPFAEQTNELRIGARHPIGLYMDDSGRLAGTMRVSELLSDGSTEFNEDEWVEGEAWRNDPEIGLFVIVERGFVGLVPRHEPHGLSRGQAARFRVNHVQPDGKLELSLRKHAHQELESDAQRVLAWIRRPNATRLGDRSSPEQIRELLSLSKKAFKRALGNLFKQRLIEIDADGYARPILQDSPPSKAAPQTTAPKKTASETTASETTEPRNRGTRR